MGKRLTKQRRQAEQARARRQEADAREIEAKARVVKRSVIPDLSQIRLKQLFKVGEGGSFIINGKKAIVSSLYPASEGLVKREYFTLIKNRDGSIKVKKPSKTELEKSSRATQDLRRREGEKGRNLPGIIP